MEKINTKIKKISSENNKFELPYFYFMLAFLRLFFTIVPQPGYIHPDEFFQSIEVILGDVYDFHAAKVWEFKREFPLRCIAVIYMVYSIPLLIAKYLAMYSFILQPSPYLLLVLPRLMCCLFSYAVDFSLYRICELCQINPTKPLVMLASSYVMFIYGTRTFSNTIELILVSVLLYIVADCMHLSEQVSRKYLSLENKISESGSNAEKLRLYSQQKQLRTDSLQHCTVISAILVFGIFNRPTFINFAFPPIFFWLRCNGNSQKISLRNFHFRIIALILTSIPFVAIITIIDSIYYGYTSIQEFLSMNTILHKSYVCTPYNFLKYNFNSTNLSVHGIHPRYQHVLFNIPLLFNVLGIAQIYYLMFNVYRFFTRRWNELPKLQSIHTMLIFSFIVPLVALSVFPHQEPRFLIPLIIPVVFLQTNIFRSSQPVSKSNICWKKCLLAVWWLGNIAMFFFYGFFHQAGLYPLLSDLSDEYHSNPNTKLYIASSHTYSLPLSILQIPSDTKNKNIGGNYQSIKPAVYNFGSSHTFDIIAVMVKTVEQIEKKRSKNTASIFKTYIVLPTVLSGLFHKSMLPHNISFHTTRVYYPHISVEALSKIYRSENISNVVTYDSSKSNSDQSVLDYMGLSLIRIYSRDGTPKLI